MIDKADYFVTLPVDYLIDRGVWAEAAEAAGLSTWSAREVGARGPRDLTLSIEAAERLGILATP